MQRCVEIGAISGFDLKDIALHIFILRTFET